MLLWATSQRRNYVLWCARRASLLSFLPSPGFCSRNPACYIRAIIVCSSMPRNVQCSREHMFMTINGQASHSLASFGLCGQSPGMVVLTLARPLAKEVKSGSSILGSLSVSYLGEEGTDASYWAIHSSFVCIHKPWIQTDSVSCCLQRWEGLRV